MAESIEEILAKEPRIVRIDPAEKWQFPNIDYSLWSRKRSPGAREVINLLQDALKGPYIVDDFESDHSRRRDWRTEMSKRYEWFFDYYTTNALKGGVVFEMYHLSNMLQTGYRGNSNRLKQMVQELKDLFPKEYDSKSSEEKVRFVKEYKQKVYGVLQFISVDKTLPQRILDYVSDFVGRFRNRI